MTKSLSDLLGVPMKKTLSDLLQQIQEAYLVLSDPVKRKDYDLCKEKDGNKDIDEMIDNTCIRNIRNPQSLLTFTFFFI